MSVRSTGILLPISPDDHESGQTVERRDVVVPVSIDESATCSDLSVAIARSRKGDLHAAALVTGPGSTVVDPAEFEAQQIEAGHAPSRSFDDVDTATVSVRDTVGVGASSSRAIADAVERSRADTVVLDTAFDTGREGGLFDDFGAGIASTAGCDVIGLNRDVAVDDIASVLVPVAGGPHSSLAIEIGAVVAEAAGAWVELLHVTTEDTSTADRERMERRLDELVADAATDRIDAWTLEADDVTDAIVEQSACHDVTILGAPTTGRLRRFVFGSTTDTVRDRTTAPVVVVRAGPSTENTAE